MEKRRLTYAVEKARDGNPTLLVHTGQDVIHIHSAYRPEGDWRIFKDAFNPGKYDILVVFGAGLGYHLQGLSKIIGMYRRVIIIDIIYGIEEELRKIPASAFLGKHPSIVFLSGLELREAEKALEEKIDLAESRGLQVLEHPASVRVAPDYYREIKDIIARLVNRKGGDMVTRSALGRRFFRNAVINLMGFGHHRPFNALEGRFTNAGALVAASGPSLTKIIPALGARRNRVFIIAVDSALPVLTGHGIHPDFFVSIDPQPYIMEHFDRTGERRGIPLLTMTTDPGIFAAEAGFLSLNTHPVSQFIEEAAPRAVGSFHSASGTVAGDAVKAALLMGFQAIGLAGFDFSFPGLEIYARGSAYQHRYAAIFHDRTAPVETRNLRYIMKSSGAVKQGGLYTRKSFIRYREALADMAQKEGGGRIRVIAPGPALPGIATQEMEKFIDSIELLPDAGKNLVRSAIEEVPALGKTIDISHIMSLLSDDVRSKITRASLEGDDGGIARGEHFFAKMLETRS